jgi:hypothetical protein
VSLRDSHRVQQKAEHFTAAIALTCVLQFVKTHGTLRCTPAMEAGIEKGAWTVAGLVDAA